MKPVDISLERLQELLATFPRLTIGLVGDLFLDRYLEIPVGAVETSVETGLDAYQVSRVRNMPGALGTVLNNLAALRVGLLVPVTVIGDDGHGYDLKQAVTRLPVDPRHLLLRSDRLTPTYTKPMLEQPDGSWRELNRLDVRSREPLTPETRLVLAEHLVTMFRECDGVIVLDQVPEENCGVIDEEIRSLLTELCRKFPRKLVFVDSRAYLGRFQTGTLKGNSREILLAAGHAESATELLEASLQSLTARTGRPTFCTRGEEGMLVGTPEGRVSRVPTVAVSGPIDIVGAGDAATSGIVASLLSGASELEAALIGNLAASITIQQLGTTGTASPEQLCARWYDWRS